MSEKDPSGPFPEQENWWRLKQQFGEKGAYKELARRLRQTADYLDQYEPDEGRYPDVFGCRMPESEPMCSGEHFIDSIAVTLSMPWPG